MADTRLTQQELEWVAAREKRLSEEAEKIGTLRALVLERLHGGLWHTTHPERFEGIVRSGAIRPEPDIPGDERWAAAAAGKEYYPYVRTIGGVSLFDFDQFDPDKYEEDCPASIWVEFVPYRSAWKCAAWIEIDRNKIARDFISGVDLWSRWKADNARHHMIMPFIEAAHLNPPCKLRCVQKRIYCPRRFRHA